MHEPAGVCTSGVVGTVTGGVQPRRIDVARSAEADIEWPYTGEEVVLS